jgi:precorrin-3B C17-methyltransferase
LGSGGPTGLSLAAVEALKTTEIVLGYKLYVEAAKPFLSPEAIAEASGMTGEMARSERALELAAEGRRVALVSGGDPGVYAMSGAVFEVAARQGLKLGTGPGEMDIKVVTGSPAITAAAALLGAPLTHDFCAVSLSDRLTKWRTIEMRLDLASKAGFVIAVYNPKSHGRPWQLGRATEILLRNLPPSTCVGLASRLGRPGETVSLTTLDRLAEADVDMQTIVIIGNSTTFAYQGRMITPRGYLAKYAPNEDGRAGAEGDDDGEEPAGGL